MGKLTWTLLVLASLGGNAFADDPALPATQAYGEAVMVSGSSRGVAQDYLVLPSGGELTGQWKFIMADSMLGDGHALKFTDLALFGLTGRWSLFGKLELAGTVDFLPKQPSYSDEKPWQSAGLAMRSPLGHHVAVAVSAGGGHLLAHGGAWTREALMVEWKKPIQEEFLAFDVQTGLDGVGISSPGGSQNAFLTELATQTSALFREPTGHWGAWLGIAYAIPVQHSGSDPTTMLPIQPHPRLDVHLGTALAATKQWDLFVDLAVINRGDLANPQTTLPILDGGFSQRQIVFGVTRHIEHEEGARHVDDDDSMRLSMR